MPDPAYKATAACDAEGKLVYGDGNTTAPLSPRPRRITKAALIRFYQKHNAENVAIVDDILRERDDEYILAAAQERYGAIPDLLPEPSDTNKVDETQRSVVDLTDDTPAEAPVVAPAEARAQALMASMSGAQLMQLQAKVRLGRELLDFYNQHNPSHAAATDDAHRARMVETYVHRREELNLLLRSKYGRDLDGHSGAVTRPPWEGKADGSVDDEEDVAAGGVVELQLLGGAAAGGAYAF